MNNKEKIGHFFKKTYSAEEHDCKRQMGPDQNLLTRVGSIFYCSGRVGSANSKSGKFSQIFFPFGSKKFRPFKSKNSQG